MICGVRMHTHTHTHTHALSLSLSLTLFLSLTHTHPGTQRCIKEMRVQHSQHAWFYVTQNRVVMADKYHKREMFIFMHHFQHTNKTHTHTHTHRVTATYTHTYTHTHTL